MLNVVDSSEDKADDVWCKQLKNLNEEIVWKYVHLGVGHHVHLDGEEGEEAEADDAGEVGRETGERVISQIWSERRFWCLN